MSGAACTRTGSSVAGDSRLLTIVHTEYGMCLTTMEFADWREVQDAFSGYKASLGPWSVTEILEYLPIEYPTEQPFTAEAVRALADAEDATLWSRQLTHRLRPCKMLNQHIREWSLRLVQQFGKCSLGDELRGDESIVRLLDQNLQQPTTRPTASTKASAPSASSRSAAGSRAAGTR